jgi:hypothetical protein
MNSQSIIPDFWEKPPTQPTKTQSQLSHAYGSLPQRQTLDSSHPPHQLLGYSAYPQNRGLKKPKNNNNMKPPTKTQQVISALDEPVHNYQQRLARSRHNIAPLPNGAISLQFLDHMGALNLSVGRVSKYAAHPPSYYA